jgi:dihydrolipoamide dehydrogenase
MYDIVIIGSGPAGHTAALEAAKCKLKTAIIEREPEKIGGVCLNEGCIPLKGLLHYSMHETDYHYIRGNVMQRVGFIRDGLRNRMENAGIDIINGEARFKSPHEIEVAGKTITFGNMIIAVGSSSKKIFNNPAVYAPEKIFELGEVPKKALIIGGGVIGCEYASFLNNIGVSVDIVELMDSILFGEDMESVRTVAREFKKKNIKLFEKSEVMGISTDREVQIRSGDTIIMEKYDMIFEATGRRPNTGRIGLDIAGVKVDEKGFIEVNNNMQTSAPNIYAAGDCIAGPMLAYAAAREASTVISHITKSWQGNIDYDMMPKLVFSCPQLGSVGVSVEKAKKKGIDFRVYKYFFKAIGKAVVEGRDAGFLKLIADVNEGTIIGAAGVGNEMADIFNELTVIIQSKIKIAALKECMFIHPSYSEIIAEALNWG